MRRRLLLAALFVLGIPGPAGAEMKLAILTVKGMVCPS
jgi:hypothetical protein